MRKFMAAVALFGIACGGGESAGDAATEEMDHSEMSAEEHATMGGTGTVHEVQMVLTEDGNYRYVPDALTIKVGDTVRWINVSGGPHNVAFYADSIPGGAADFLGEAMPNQMMPLSGGFMTAPNATYDITFVGAPTGEYGYVCTPHEPMGMVAKLTVEE